MNHDETIYQSPLSQETKIIRRNLLIASGVCLFIGLTGQLPEKFALLGMTFDTTQKATIGWFIASIFTYLYLHFVSGSFVEVARWIEPFIKATIERKKLLKHPAIDETHFMDIGPPVDPHNMDAYYAETSRDASWRAKYNLRHLYRFIYIKLALEVALPILFGGYALFELVDLITSGSM